jgi:hypothetical protein
VFTANADGERLPVITPHEDERRRKKQGFGANAATAGGQLFRPMTPITDVDSQAAMSREVSTFGQLPVLPSIRQRLEIESHDEGRIIFQQEHYRRIVNRGNDLKTLMNIHQRPLLYGLQRKLTQKKVTT